MQTKLTGFTKSGKRTRASKRSVEDDCEDASPKKAKMVSPKKSKAGKKVTIKSLLKGVADDWVDVLQPEMKKEYFGELLEFLNDEYENNTIHPDPADIFAAFAASPLDQVRAVILGQDPYPTPGNAHGLCFSVQLGVKTPQSLKNMYKELTSDEDVDFTAPDPPHGHLISWAQQGVLLLNTVLTVRTGKANSHKSKGWEKFTDRVIQVLSEQKKNVVFLLWGKPSQKKGSSIDKRKHCVIQSVHPSPLSASRGFFGCKCFSLTNTYLTNNSLPPIDWQLPSAEELQAMREGEEELE